MNTLNTPSDFYDDICDKIAKEISKFTPQLFSVKDHKSRLPPRADSSSVLLSVRNRFFLITAGHTIHSYDLNCIGVMLGNDFYTIGGLLKCFEPNELNDYDPNKIDMAVFELEHNTVNVIKEKYQFLQWNKVGLNHSSSNKSPYLTFGYPGQKTKKHYPTKQIIPSPFILRTIGTSNECYIKAGIDTNKIIILAVDQKRVASSFTKEIEILPELGGISGCGVWSIFNLLGENPQYELVSITAHSI